MRVLVGSRSVLARDGSDRRVPKLNGKVKESVKDKIVKSFVSQDSREFQQNSVRTVSANPHQTRDIQERHSKLRSKQKAFL